MWQNPNPSSSFPAQDIALQNTYYDYLIVLFTYNTSLYDRVSSTMMFKIGCDASAIITSSVGARMVQRGIVRKTSGDPYTLSVTDCSLQIIGQNPTVDNARMIPYIIYGVALKG